MSAPAWSWRRALLVSPIALYAATIPLVSNLQLDRGFRVLLYQNRSYVILGAVAFAVVALVAFAPKRVGWALASPWHRQLMVASLLFPISFAAFSVVKGFINVPVIGLYLVWSVAVFFVAPLLFNTPERLRAAAVALLVANLLAWLLGLFLFSTRTPVTMFAARDSLGFSNPNSYAQILQVIGCTAALLLVTGGRTLVRRRMLAIVCALSVLLVIAAESRNVMAFAVSGVAAYRLLEAGRGRRLVLSLGYAAVAVAAVAALSYADLTEVDHFSSGRITLWKRTLDEVFVRGDNGAAFLIGRERELSRRLGTRSYSNIVETATFEKYRVDNLYLELMVEAGAIGTLLFLWPYVLLAIMLWRHRRFPPGRRRANFALAFLIGLAVQSAFSPTIPSFNSPVGFMFATIAIALLAVGRHEAASDGR